MTSRSRSPFDGEMDDGDGERWRVKTRDRGKTARYINPLRGTAHVPWPRRDVRRTCGTRAWTHVGARVWARVCFGCARRRAACRAERKRAREREKEGGKRESVSHEPWGANKRVVAVVRCGVGSGISSYSISTLPPTPGSDRRRPSVAPSPSPPSRSPSSRPCALRFPHSRE